MNCADVRQRLLLSERPDKPAVEESRHLAGCSACHAWLRRLVRLERQITELHVPASAVPAGLLEQITEAAEAPLVVRPSLQPSSAMRNVREVGRQKLALASALAATLALFTLAWWLWPPKQTPPAAPWRDPITKRIAAATTLHDRVGVMAGLPNDLLDVAQERGDNPLQIAQVAEDFDKWVSDLVVAASKMSPGDQAQLLPKIADRLKQAGTRAKTLADEWKARRPEAAKSVGQMAESAREAEKRLRGLART